MLLVVDIGNTNTVLGVYNKEELLFRYRVATNLKRTSDELVATLFNMFNVHGIDKNFVDDTIISCVVPDILYSWQSCNRKMFDKDPILVNYQTDSGIEIAYDIPREVGADRIVDAVAVYNKYGGPSIIVDMGTAITFDVVTKDGKYLGGSIAPGIKIAQDGLFGKTAQLPKIELRNPESAIAKNTVDSINAGIVFGYISLIDGLIFEIEKELREDYGIEGEINVVATGGYSELISNESKFINKIEPDLMLDGLRLIYERIKK
ncbi:type III pantothenate kinase [Anaerococcus sp. Marseille-P3625]|uniref:type III pantothenate kinase n=1 Tax=Anaerococcus sp. Marseille-P3625 TaxID=1977277 RepID=UPI000C071577|nr:type III pantothenate kinase [Anaerococcus sp. Marseille-P3625]